MDTFGFIFPNICSKIYLLQNIFVESFSQKMKEEEKGPFSIQCNCLFVFISPFLLLHLSAILAMIV